MRHLHSGIRLLTITMLAALLSGNHASATAAPPCTSHLLVELTPDVPDPTDAGFLSSLLNDHPAYRLAFAGHRGPFVVILELTGPGPDEQCGEVIETMRKDARVQSIERDVSLTR